MNKYIKQIRAFLHPYRVKLERLKMRCFEPVFHHFPIKDKILFANFTGRGLGDDPKYILMELLRRPHHPELYWIVANNSITVPEGVKRVKIYSINYVYHLCTSKVWVFNIKSLWKLRKRVGQYYLQTWHATIGLKKAEKSVANTLGDYYCATSQSDSKMIDLLYSNNDKSIDFYRNDFWYDGPIIKTDVPRTGVLINPEKNLKKKVSKLLGFDSEKKIILYAPTFRKTTDLSLFVWDYIRVTKAISARFGDNFVFLVRLHPNIAIYASELQYNDTIINASAYPDMQELLAASDILINDYSSSMFEFGFLHKPVFLYAKDRIDFITGDRSLFFDFSELPFSFSESLDELCDNIKNFDTAAYNQNCDMFYKKIGFEDHGNGATIIADLIMKQFANHER